MSSFQGRRWFPAKNTKGNKITEENKDVTSDEFTRQRGEAQWIVEYAHYLWKKVQVRAPARQLKDEARIWINSVKTCMHQRQERGVENLPLEGGKFDPWQSSDPAAGPDFNKYGSLFHAFDGGEGAGDGEAVDYDEAFTAIEEWGDHATSPSITTQAA